MSFIKYIADENHYKEALSLVIFNEFNLCLDA